MFPDVWRGARFPPATAAPPASTQTALRESQQQITGWELPLVAHWTVVTVSSCCKWPKESWRPEQTQRGVLSTFTWALRSRGFKAVRAPWQMGGPGVGFGLHFTVKLWDRGTQVYLKLFEGEREKVGLFVLDMGTITILQVRTLIFKKASPCHLRAAAFPSWCGGWLFIRKRIHFCLVAPCAWRASPQGFLHLLLSPENLKSSRDGREQFTPWTLRCPTDISVHGFHTVLLFWYR